MTIQDLERKVEQLENRLQQLENLRQIEVPDWAKDVVNRLANTPSIQGKTMILENPWGGSYDFYRVLTILDRAGSI